MGEDDLTTARPAPEISIRAYDQADAPAVLRVFQTAITEGAARFYDPAQRAAWAAALVDADAMAARLSGLEVWLAVTPERDQVIGFMTLASNGHIDFAFVAPAVMGQGVAQALYEVIETHACAASLPRLSTEASHPARRFFVRHGWRVDKTQSVQRAGVSLENFAMSKALGLRRSAG
jgi:putative acetyltransferase